MKFLIALLLVLTTVETHAGVTGIYQAQKEITLFAETIESCQELQGRWNHEEEICILKTADEATIQKNHSGYKLHISTFGTNYHTCDFEGQGQLENGVIVSHLRAENYDLEQDRIVTIICEVRAKIENGVMSISTNQKCQNFCGANAWLEVTNLIKVK